MREAAAGWGVHAVVLLALAAAGVGITVLDRSSPAGGWISLRGLMSWLAWIVLACFAAISTATFALLRGRIGAPLSYAVAVPIAAALAGFVLWAGGEIHRAKNLSEAEAARRDLGSRLTLESWSMEERTDGLVHFVARVRAERDGEISLEPSAEIDGNVVLEPVVPHGREGSLRVHAEDRVVLEADARRTGPGAFGAVHLYFDSRVAVRDPAVPGGVAMRESATLVYSGGTEGDLLVNPSMLRKPLPPPSPR